MRHFGLDAVTDGNKSQWEIMTLGGSLYFILFNFTPGVLLGVCFVGQYLDCTVGNKKRCKNGEQHSDSEETKQCSKQQSLNQHVFAISIVLCVSHRATGWVLHQRALQTADINLTISLPLNLV